MDAPYRELFIRIFKSVVALLVSRKINSVCVRTGLRSSCSVSLRLMFEYRNDWNKNVVTIHGNIPCESRMTVRYIAIVLLYSFFVDFLVLL